MCVCVCKDEAYTSDTGKTEEYNATIDVPSKEEVHVGCTQLSQTEHPDRNDTITHWADTTLLGKKGVYIWEDHQRYDDCRC